MPNPPLPPPATPSAETIVGYQIGGQSANQRVWQKIVKVTGSDGNFTFQTNQAYVELASGLNYQDPVTGQWLASREEVEAYSGGAIAQYGQYKVTFGNNLNTAGAIDLQTPDGKELKSHVLGLSYFDLASGKSVLIAQTKDCQGQIAGSNQVLFADAFQGVNATVQYVYRRGSFEQNVILEAQLPSPESFGLFSTSCVLQVLTGFDSAPAPAITAITNGSAAALPDELLNFGTMYMTRGNAFLLGTNLPSAAVCKQWLDVNGRTVLVESVPLPAISASLSQLPAVAKATFKPMAGSVQYVVSSKRLLPPPPAGNGTRTKMEFARTGGQASGLVLDYITINGNEPNYTFQGDSTYYVSGPVYLSGTAAFEGGSVIKYTNNNPFLDLSACTQIECLTAPYHPVVFTAKDDNSVGAPINGSIGYASGYYANPAIRYFPYGYGSLSLTNFRIAYAYQAVFASAPTMTVSLSDGQIVVCGTGFYTPGQTSAHLENMLFADVGLPLELYLADVQAQNVTFTAGGYALVGPAGSGPNYNVTLNLVNCILANFYAICTIPGFTIPTGDHNGFYPAYSPVVGNPYFTCSSNPFQSAGGGYYYLNNDQNGGAQFQGVGSTAIDSTLLNSLKTKTTRPPDISYIGHTITSDTFTTLVLRDGESPGPDIGYHYYSLDYIFQNSTVASTKITFPAGMAVGWRGQGLTLTSYYPVNFNGLTVSNDYFVRCNTVQESDQSADGIGIAGSSQISPQYAPNVNATFTRFSALGDFAAFFDANHWYVNFCNCEFWDGALGETGGAIGLGLVSSNCLYDRTTIIVPAPPQSQYYNDTDFLCQDCTLHGGSLAFNNSPPPNINAYAEVTNTAFDGTTIQVNGGSVYITGGYNAYLNVNGTTTLPNDFNDQSVSTFNWQKGLRGNFYLPNDPPANDGTALIDKGSLPATQVIVAIDGATGAQLPLSTFTTQVSQSADINTVDIGYHYPLRSTGPNVLIVGNGANSVIYTYNFANGALIYSFPPDGASQGNGRAVAINGGKMYYTEVNQEYNDAIHVCPFVTSGPAPHDLPNSPPQQTSPLPNPAPGTGTAGLAFAVDPANGKTELFVLTGYELPSPPQPPMMVYEIDPATGSKVVGGTVPQAGISITTPGSPHSDGFTVLPDGNFLINDGDGFSDNVIYREYYSSGPNVGQVRSPSNGGLKIDLSGYGFSDETGVTLAPDEKSLYFVTGINGSYQTLVQIDLSGNLLGAQPININVIEGIAAVPQ